MTLKQILYVRAVSKAGSIGKAAEALFISQSSLSESIQNLNESTTWCFSSVPAEVSP